VLLDCVSSCGTSLSLSLPLLSFFMLFSFDLQTAYV
jgi:hypothetical protein